MFRSPSPIGRAGSIVNSIRAAAVAVAVGVVGVTAAPAMAASPGTLDSSFGSGGIASASGGIRFFADAVQSDGKIVAVGEDGVGSAPDVVVARFTSSGALDHSFGGSGLVRGPALSGGLASDSMARAVAIQPDGKIVVVGSATGANSSGGAGLIVERYNADGSLDKSFGSGGVQNLLTSALADGYGVALQSNGDILASGAADAQGSNGYFPRMTVVRLTPTGALDTSFGSGGVDILSGLGPEAAARGVAVQKDGKIVLVGSEAPGLQVPEALIVRLTSAGALDTSFAGSGFYAHQYSPSGGANSGFNAVALQGDGAIVAAGAAVTSAQTADAFVARFTSAGAPDGSFGSGGVVNVPSAVNSPPGSSGVPGANGVVALSNGDVVAAGTAVNGLEGRAALWAFNSHGAPDTAFGSGGTVTTSLGFTGEYGGLAVDRSGNLIAAGDSQSSPQSNYTGVVARYVGFGAAPPPPPPPPPSSTSRIGLMGRMGFVSPGGVIGVQVGCFNGRTRCTGHIEMTHNGTVVGATNFNLAPESGGFQNLKLSSAGRDLLKRNHRFHLLPVQVRVTGSGGQKINQVMHLARWIWGNGSGIYSTTKGPLPGALPPASGTSRIGLMGRMGFVSPGGVIGVQVGCFNGHTRCTGHIEMTHNGTVVGRTNFDLAPETGGFQNLGLTSLGRRMLNQNRVRHLLAVQVVITGGNGQRIAEVMHLARWLWT